MGIPWKQTLHTERSETGGLGVPPRKKATADMPYSHFGPSLVPLLQVGWRGLVQTDAAFKAHLVTVQNLKDSCGQPSWDSMLYYAKRLTQKKIKVAFFSSTPQGGGVALMRHALVRFSRLMGVDLTWYGE